MKRFSELFQKSLHLILMIAIFLFVFAAIAPPRKGEAYIGDFSSESFNTGWVCIDGETRTAVTLPTALDGESGKRLFLENTLPETISDGMRICARASMQDLKIYVDGELRSSYTSDGFDRMSYSLPGAYLLADLSAQDAGKTVRLEIVSKSGHSLRLDTIQLCYGNNFWFGIFRSNLPVVLSASASILFGFLAICGYLIVQRRLHIGKSLFYLGETMVVAGLWILSESKMRQILFRSPSYSSIFAFLLVESVVGFAALYFDSVQNYHYHRYYSLLEGIVAAQVLVNSVLHFSGIIEYYNTLKFAHIWIVVGILLTCTTLLLDLRSGRIRSYSITAFGMVLLLLSCTIEIISFYFLDFYIMGLFTICGLILLLCATFFQTIYDEIQKSEARRIHLEHLNQNTVETVARAIDAKDAYTGGHSERVADYAEKLARYVADRYDLTEKDIRRIHYIGLLHDIGKIGVPDAILNKPGRLTSEEFEKMKQHVLIGEQLVAGIEMPELSTGVRNHHERWDGLGYPDNLAGEEIPLAARILCIADCYDAMTSDRVYRKRLPLERVLEEFRRCSGTQFDPELDAAWLELLEKEAAASEA